MAACPVPVTGSVVTIGAYDGVHLGHRAVIDEVRARASTLGVPTAVVTFDRHPAAVVRPTSAPRLLTDTDQKLELLADAGVDYTLVLHFDEERSHESAEDFVNEVLAGCLRARLVVVGEDFHFGRNRGGNVELLRRMGPNLGFEVEGLTLVPVPGVEGPVSSTAIRRTLVEGDVVTAARLLGRPHEVRGAVERGDGRGGNVLGFPTANVAVPNEIQLPADGTSVPMARRTRPPSQLAGVPPSTPRAAPSWSRPTSSTSTATSTASAPRFGSPVACAGKSASSPPTPSSPK